MGCENYESGIIMKVDVKVTKRDMQRLQDSLGDKDIYLHVYRYTDEHMCREFTQQI